MSQNPRDEEKKSDQTLIEEIWDNEVNGREINDGLDYTYEEYEADNGIWILVSEIDFTKLPRPSKIFDIGLTFKPNIEIAPDSFTVMLQTTRGQFGDNDIVPTTNLKDRGRDFIFKELNERFLIIDKTPENIHSRPFLNVFGSPYTFDTIYGENKDVPFYMRTFPIYHNEYDNMYEYIKAQARKSKTVGKLENNFEVVIEDEPSVGGHVYFINPNEESDIGRFYRGEIDSLDKADRDIMYDNIINRKSWSEFETIACEVKSDNTIRFLSRFRWSYNFRYHCVDKANFTIDNVFSGFLASLIDKWNDMDDGITRLEINT